MLTLRSEHHAQRPGRYHLTTDLDGAWSFFAGPAPDRIDDLRPVARLDGPGDAAFETPSGYARTFIRPVRDGVALPVITERHLPFPHLFNFRDMGGYGAVDRGRKRRVGWGRLYRTGHWAKANAAESAALAELAVDTLIDFRGEPERAAAPDRIPENVRRVLHLPIPAGDLDGDRRLQRILAGRDPAPARALMQSIYADLPTAHKAAYKDFFAALADAQGPVAFHCTAGKDRTGVGAALLLYALGVDPETVLADYLRSRAAAEMFARDAGMANPAAEPLMTVDKTYLAQALRTVVRAHGSVTRYLAAALDVDLAALRAKYLE